MISSPDIGLLSALLRRRFSQHNRHVLMMAAGSLVAAVVLWSALYLAAAWLTLLATTVVSGLEGHEAAMPPHFRLSFSFAAALLLAAAWYRHVSTPDDAARNSKTWWDHILDLALSVPTLTLAVWGNLSAWQHLDALDCHQAAELLTAVHREKRLPVGNVPLLIPAQTQRDKILLGLLLIGMLELRQEGTEAHLRLASATERHLSHEAAAALEAARSGARALLP